MIYTATQINESPTIIGKAGAGIASPTDVRGKAIKFDAQGELVLAGAGEVAVGIAILTNDEATKAGLDVTVQVKEMGVALAGGEIKAGAELASDADGKVVEATSGQFVIGTALESATAGKYVRIQITKYAKA